MTHPLTDETIHEEFLPKFCYIENDMRAAYDKGFSDAIECIRKAGLAHWSALYEVKENLYKQQQEEI